MIFFISLNILFLQDVLLLSNQLLLPDLGVYAGKRTSKYWGNGVTNNLSSGNNPANANAIAVAGTDVYVSGFERNAAGISVAKYWKNGVQVILDGGTGNLKALSIFIK